MKYSTFYFCKQRCCIFVSKTGDGPVILPLGGVLKMVQNQIVPNNELFFILFYFFLIFSILRQGKGKITIKTKQFINDCGSCFFFLSFFLKHFSKLKGTNSIYPFLNFKQIHYIDPLHWRSTTIQPSCENLSILGPIFQ